MDSFALKAIAAELDANLRGGIVDKIHQPQKSMVLLDIHPPARSNRSPAKVPDSLPRPSGKKIFRLLISVDAGLPRAHLTGSEFENPKTALSFCMLLRKHLTGARIVTVALRGIERILNLTLENRDPVGRILRYTLVAEIMGRHSNLFLVDSRTGIILDALKAVPPGRSAARPIQRNNPYVPPPAQEKEDPLLVEEEALLELAARAGRPRKNEKVSAKWLVSTFAGISPDVAAWVADRAKESGLWDAFRETRDRFREERFSPGILTVNEADEGSLWVLPVPAGKRFLSFPSANAAADALYGRSWDARRLGVRQSAVQKELNNALKRKRRTADQIRKDLGRAREADEQQRRGQILLENLGSIPKGAESIRLRDPHTAEEVDIPLDVKLSPTRNAERYFSRAKKLRRMSDLGSKRLKETEGQIQKLEALAKEAQASTKPETLEKIEKRMLALSPPKRVQASPVEQAAAKDGANGRKKPVAARAPGRGSAGKGKKPAVKKESVPPDGKGRRRQTGGKGKDTKGKAADAGPGVSTSTENLQPQPAPSQKTSKRRQSSDHRSFGLEGGWEVLVGKHDRGNDRLLRRVAGGEDVWLHAQGVPGSHVIIHHSERGKEVPLRVVEAAAKLAAYYSKGKESSKVSVDYIAVKHLRRIKGGRAGQVTFTGQSTISVSPESPEGLLGSSANSSRDREAEEEAV